ncbi:VOC family protein [Chloroflexi bacterium TSY]|nr:VOC family protein [Chloroflexi bacterium TSY]
MASAVNWFEIPVSDINRAGKFYDTILDTKLVNFDAAPGMAMKMFPAEGGTGGAIVQGDVNKPSSSEGTLVYLNGGDDLSIVLDRVEGAGGQVSMPKTSIGENGFIGMFVDTEGNKVGLHSMG